MRADQLRPWVYLLAGSVVGGLCAYLLFGGVSDERRLLNERFSEFAGMSESDRHLVRLSYEDLAAQPAARREELNRLQGLLTSDPQFEDVLKRYGEWRKSLSREELDQYVQLSSAERLEYVRSRWMRSELAGGAELEIRFPGAYARQLPVLRITAEELWRLAGTIIPEERRPEVLRQELAELETDARKGLCLTLWIFEQVSETRENPEKLRGANDGIRIARDWLLTEVGDVEWRRAFKRHWETARDRPWEMGWLLPIVYTVLSESADKLGGDLLRSFPLNEKQLLDEFALLDVVQQRELMKQSPSQARISLQFMTRAEIAETAEQRLVVKYAEFAKERDQLLRTIAYGIGVVPRQSR